MRTEVERLTQSPGTMQKHPFSGANYYSGEQIITHLNFALGPSRWDWTEVDHGFDKEADEVWVLGRLTVRFIVDAMNDEGDELETVVKEDRGWQPVNRKKDGSLISLGNDYKGADTDALKRCARLLGVGLDAWEKEGTARRKVCDVAKYRGKWHATVKGTRFEDDDTRHKFIAWYSENHFSSLEKWLDGATDEEADALIATISQRISDEAKDAAKKSQVAKTTAGVA